MKTLFLFLLITFNAYAGNQLLHTYKTDLGALNGCLVNAISFEDMLNTYKGKSTKNAALQLQRNSDRWDKVIVLSFLVNGKTVGHAICAFEYKNKLWIYDPDFGTYCIENSTDNENDVNFLANQWRSNYTVLNAYFIDDITAP